jgi:hypothetical protein
VITADSNAYHLPPIVATDGPVPSGPLLLKLIISQAHVDSRATVSFICTSLTQLDNKMTKLDSDVESFNFYVKAQIKSLSARGETSSDLLINLFKGYKAANDVEFLDFIRRKANAYEEGDDINTNNLMADSLIKFKARKLIGKWSAPTKEQDQILALTAQVELPKSAKKATKKTPADSTTKKPKSAHKDNKWAWKDTLPKAGEATTKEFEGKQYHVNCPHHPNQWVCHTAKECSKNTQQGSGAATPSGTTDTTTKAQKLAAAKLAAAALLTDGNESGEDSEGADY